MSDLVCIGEPLIELNQQSDGRYLSGIGGDTSNCAIAAARQGADVGYLCRLGDDAFGAQIQSCWQQEQIDTSGVIVGEGEVTGIYFVNHDEHGHHFSYRRKDSAASRLKPGELSPELIRNASIVHLSGISLGISSSAADAAFEAMEIASSAGRLVSFDPNYRPALWPLARARAVIHEAMSRCQIALPGLDDARLLTGLDDPDAIADFYLEMGIEVVALTLGSEGVLVADPVLSQRFPAHPVTPVDATGAGDTFDGAFLARYLINRDMCEAARYANAAAALSTQGYGAVAPIPTREQVSAMLAG